MKVKLKTGRVTNRGSDAPGTVIEVDDREGQALIDSDQAEAVKVTPKKKPKARVYE